MVNAVLEEAFRDLTVGASNRKGELTTREAGEMLGVSLRTVQLWVEAGALPAWKTPGGHRRIPRSAVEALRDEQAGVSAPAAVPVAPGMARVVIVEDDARLRRLYELTLRSWALPLDLALTANGFEALLAIGRVAPAMIITDLDMPYVDGFEMLRALAGRPAAEVGRLVVVSGLDSQTIAARGGLPAGVELLPKPVPFDRLRRITDEVLATLASGPVREDA